MQKKWKQNPQLSVILPVYNAGNYLSACLDSIVSQTYSNFEVIAIDDGSTDNSVELLREFAHTYPNIKIARNKENRGIGYTVNKALSKAKGQFIARMDADDAMLPERLEKQIKYLQQNPETVLVGGQCLVIDEDGNTTGTKQNPQAHSDIYKKMFTTMSVQNPTVMINTALVPKKALVHDNSLHPVDDLDLLFRLFNYGKFSNLPDAVLKYRVYRNSSTMKDPKRSFLLTLKVRWQAIVKYGYRPNLLSILTCFAQTLTVLLLPNTAVYTLYAHLRGVKRVTFSRPLRPLLAYSYKRLANLLVLQGS